MIKKKVDAFGVTFQPRTYTGMLSGVKKLANAIRPTLGPFPHLVAVSSTVSGKPELLNDGGTIARRMIQLPNRDEDIGAMYLRHVLTRIHEECGDGTATSAVLFHEILQQGVRHIVYGGHAMPFRRHLEAAACLVENEMKKLARPVVNRNQVVQIAKSICYEPLMAQLLGEIFDTIGAFGHLELRTGQGRGLDHEYTEGSFWEGPLHSVVMINQPSQNRAVLENAGILITDFSIDDPHHLVRVIVEAKKAGKTSLMLICNAISEPCIGFLMADSTRNVLPVITVKTPASNLEEQLGAVEDIAALTGAQPMTRHAGETLEGVTGSHFGQARSVWANNQFFGILGGQGDPRRIRHHIHRLKSLFANLEVGDSRSLVRKRIGKMSGGSATLWVGGATEAEMNVRKDLAERAAEAIRGAILQGVLPGGGASFLACKPALKVAMQHAEDPDEIAAYRIVMNAMDQPLRTMAANAGLIPEEVMAEIKQSGSDCCFDLRKRQIMPFDQADLWDSASVVQTVAHHSITSAALLLTVDVLVHHKKPETAAEP